MKLVRVLPSAEDEFNVASFHPSVGGGLVYGTKELKLRILQPDNSHSLNYDRSYFPDDNMYEACSGIHHMVFEAGLNIYAWFRPMHLRLITVDEGQHMKRVITVYGCDVAYYLRKCPAWPASLKSNL